MLTLKILIKFVVIGLKLLDIGKRKNRCNYDKNLMCRNIKNFILNESSIYKDIMHVFIKINWNTDINHLLIMKKLAIGPCL